MAKSIGCGLLFNMGLASQRWVLFTSRIYIGMRTHNGTFTKRLRSNSGLSQVRPHWPGSSALRMVRIPHHVFETMALFMEAEEAFRKRICGFASAGVCFISDVSVEVSESHPNLL